MLQAMMLSPASRPTEDLLREKLPKKQQRRKLDGFYLILISEYATGPVS